MRRLGLSGIRSGWMRGVFRAHFLPFSVQILRLRVAGNRELQCGMAEWQERITINPRFVTEKRASWHACDGSRDPRQPRCGPTPLINRRQLPSIRELDIQASLAYPAELAREGTADLPLEHTV